MNITKIQTEQMTALTDIALALLTLVFCLVFFFKKGERNEKKSYFWHVIFFLLFASSSAGVILHGLVWGKIGLLIIGTLIGIFLTVSITLYALAAYCEVVDKTPCFKTMVWVIVAATMFAVLVSGSNILVLRLFQLVSLIFALSIYVFMVFRKKDYHAVFMITGIVITLISALIQLTGKMDFEFFWKFDHNSIYHIVQIPGLFLIFLGAKKPN